MTSPIKTKPKDSLTIKKYKEIYMSFKNVLLTAVALTCILAFSGCAFVTPIPPQGGIYTSVTAPDPSSTIAMRTGETTPVGTSKKGVATATGILGAVATGDASIKAAMENGGITKVHHVDYQKDIVLFGLYQKLTTIVYGE
jgi:hypothetical protein